VSGRTAPGDHSAAHSGGAVPGDAAPGHHSAAHGGGTVPGDAAPGRPAHDDVRLVGVIDVGGFGAADPALDLVAAWHLLDDEPRQVLRTALGCDDLEWERGKAWAFEQAMGLVWYYAQSNPTMSSTGRRTLGRLVADGAIRSSGPSSGPGA